MGNNHKTKDMPIPGVISTHKMIILWYQKISKISFSAHNIPERHQSLLFKVPNVKILFLNEKNGIIDKEWGKFIKFESFSSHFLSKIVYVEQR